MESNWRWNVWDLGLDPEVYRLCARFVFPDYYWVCKTFFVPTEWRYVVIDTSPGWPYPTVFGSLPLPADAPFRPIYDVEPD